MSEYIFAAHDSELRRLRLIEEALDLRSIDYLERTGIGDAWSCLKLGAGAGSLAVWMGDRVGDSGQVVAVDKNVEHLQHSQGSRFQVIEGDYVDVAIDDAFDLAHCRYVLIHNRNSYEILRKLIRSLKPGGWLVVEEPDFSSARYLNPNHSAPVQRVNHAISRMFEQMELNIGRYFFSELNRRQQRKRSRKVSVGSAYWFSSIQIVQ